LKSILNFLIYFVSPVIIIVAGFRFSTAIGVIAVMAYFLLIFYYLRPQIYRLKGSKSYSNDNFKDAIMWFEKAYKTGRGGTGTAVSLAYIMLKNGDVEASETLFKKTYEAKSTEEDYRKIIKGNVALVKWKKGDIDGAIEMLENLVKEFKTTNIYGSLGYLYIAKGDYEKALEFNQEALDYNSTNSIILDNLGETYYCLERYEEAEETYKKIMESNPKFPEAYYHYGLVLEKLDRKEEAQRCFEKAATFKTNFLSTVTEEQIQDKLGEPKKDEE